MKVQIRLKDSSQPIERENVVNTYEKGNFYCLYLESELVKKYPLADIFDVTEDYGKHP